MAYKTRSIGTFAFAFLSGMPQQGQEMVQTLDRAGVDGHAIRLLGVRYPQFELMSKVSVDTFENAVDLVQDYKNIVGGAPVQLTWENQDYESATLDNQHKVQVLGVRMESLSTPATMVGNLTSANDLAWLTCTWTLQLVDVTV